MSSTTTTTTTTSSSSSSSSTNSSQAVVDDTRGASPTYSSQAASSSSSSTDSSQSSSSDATSPAAVASSSTSPTPTASAANTSITTASLVVLPTTSATNTTASSASASSSTTPASSNTAAALIAAGYRCYRHIPFPIISSSSSSAAAAGSTSSNAQASDQRSEFEPESKRFKPSPVVGGQHTQLVSLKDEASVLMMENSCMGGICGGGNHHHHSQHHKAMGGGGSGYGDSNSNIYMVHKKLEERIGGILCCTVCLDLPKTAIYQCMNGHLMCAGCFSHLLADARLKDEQATCPNCRCEISKTSCCRNLAVEKTLSELPASCAYCSLMLARHALEHHQRSECYERPSKCVYECIGCTWEGPFHELEVHAEQCSHPNRPARDIIPFLKDKDAGLEEDQNAMSQLVNYLSLEKVCFNDLQFKQYKTDEITPKLYFETNRFNAFFHQWVLKARVNDNMKSPNLTSNRFISFQLILKSKLSSSQPNFDVKFCILRGPFGEVPINARVTSFEFNTNKLETDYIRLSINPEDCNKLLASKTINFRFFMFQA